MSRAFFYLGRLSVGKTGEAGGRGWVPFERVEEAVVVTVHFEDFDGAVRGAGCEAPAVVVENCVVLQGALARSAGVPTGEGEVLSYHRVRGSLLFVSRLDGQTGLEVHHGAWETNHDCNPSCEYRSTLKLYGVASVHSRSRSSLGEVLADAAD